MPFFGRRESRERESGVGRVGYRNMPCIFVIVPWLKVRREGAIFMELLWRVVCYCWKMFRVDKSPNEDPGPLPGPRSLFTSTFLSIGAASESQDTRDIGQTRLTLKCNNFG